MKSHSKSQGGSEKWPKVKILKVINRSRHIWEPCITTEMVNTHNENAYILIKLSMGEKKDNPENYKTLDEEFMYFNSDQSLLKFYNFRYNRISYVMNVLEWEEI